MRKQSFEWGPFVVEATIHPAEHPGGWDPPMSERPRVLLEIHVVDHRPDGTTVRRRVEEFLNRRTLETIENEVLERDESERGSTP